MSLNEGDLLETPSVPKPHISFKLSTGLLNLLMLFLYL
jgi:hypothetical protein